MMKPRLLLCLTALAIGLLAPAQPAQSAPAGWEIVASGVSYREWLLPGPNRVHVARMDRSNPSVILDSSLAQGALGIGVETVSEMAGRYDEAINAWGGTWGARNRVVVAVNGSFFDRSSGDPVSGVIHSGWFTKWYGSLEGGSGFAWTLERNAFLGQCVYRRPDRQVVTFLASGQRQTIGGIDVPMGGQDLIVYTPDYESQGPLGDSTLQVLVELNRPAMIMPLPAMVTGTVTAVRRSRNPYAILFDHVLLAANGEAQTEALANTHVGDRVGLSMEISDLGPDCKSHISYDWTKAYAGVGGSFDFLRDGVIRSFDDLGATRRNPRTAVCFNDESIDFVVVDGRAPGVSIGMTIDELARFCAETLGDTQGINQDGGGSSTLWLNGEVRNRPSDGAERPVANGLMMVVVEAQQRSHRFAPGDRVIAVEETEMRVGPGSNFRSLTTVPQGSSALILPHNNHLEGVLAKGSYWWKAQVNGAVGWIAQEALVNPVNGLSIFLVGGPPANLSLPFE